MTLPTRPIHPPAGDPPPSGTPPEPGPAVALALSSLSADPFVQAAVWRVWHYGPGLLDAGISRVITEAYVSDYAAARPVAATGGTR